MSDAKHTPTPWRIVIEDDRPHEPAIVGPEHTEHFTAFIATCCAGLDVDNKEAHANAAFILQAVNERPSLLAQLAAARSALEQSRAALKTIARGPDCGCVPCMGQCRSEVVLRVEIEEIRTIAKAALSTLAQEPAGQSEAIRAPDDVTELSLRSRARKLLTSKGWAPGANIGLHSAIELLTAFGMELSRDPETDRCAYPECGCDFDATCNAAHPTIPAGSASPGVTEPVQVVPADLSELTAQRDALNGDVHELGQRVEALEDALKNARSMLTAFGGDPRKVVAEHGSAEVDEIQAALLDQIDAALSVHSIVKVSEDAAEMLPEDMQLLWQLHRDNTPDGTRPVIESQGWEQAMRLSDAGYIAIEQLATGGCLHITRKGIRALPLTPEGRS